MLVRVRLLGLVLGVLMLGSTAGFGEDASPGKNLLADPSLEKSPVGAATPIGWRGFYSEPRGAYTSRVTEGGRTGKRSLVIEGDGQFGVASANLIPLDRKRRYAVRGWVKVEGDEGAAADVKFQYYDAAGNYLDQTRRGHVMPASKGWQFITVVDEADSVPEAKQIGLAVAITRKCKAQYDDLELLSFDREKLPKDFELEYGTMPKARVLHRRVGTWEVETTIKPCIWVPRGDKTTEIETVEWALGRQFVRTTRMAPGGGEESLSLMMYEPRTDRYLSWYFNARGAYPRGQTVGQWDADKQTLTFQGEHDGITGTFRLKLVDDKRIEFEGLYADKGGKVYIDMSGTCRRREEAALPAATSSDVEEQAVKRDLEALKGTWTVISAERDGKKLADEQLKGITLLYDGVGGATVKKGDQLLFDGTIKIDPMKKPKTLDVTQASEGENKGKTFLGIYEIEGDTLRVCSAEPAGKDRPTDFSSKPGSGHFLRIYKRGKK